MCRKRRRMKGRMRGGGIRLHILLLLSSFLWSEMLGLIYASLSSVLTQFYHPLIYQSTCVHHHPHFCRFPRRPTYNWKDCYQEHNGKQVNKYYRPSRCIFTHRMAWLPSLITYFIDNMFDNRKPTASEFWVHIYMFERSVNSECIFTRLNALWILSAYLHVWTLCEFWVHTYMFESSVNSEYKFTRLNALWSLSAYLHVWTLCEFWVHI